MPVKMNQLLRYRNVWLGVSMLWIVLYHSGLHVPSALFVYPKRWGYGGVDICLFASGIGCYFSLAKDPDILRFLKRRVQRLAPTYLCFMIFWTVYRQMTAPMPLQAVIGNFLGIQTLTGVGHDFNWYISALVLFYLAAPYLKQLADRLSRLWQQLLLMGILLLMSIPFWGSVNDLVIISRFPVYYAGFLFAKYCASNGVLHNKHIMLSAVALIVGILCLYITGKLDPEVITPYGLPWYLFLWITPSLCTMISLCAMAMEKSRIGQKLLRLLEVIGINSFELYLVHIPLFEVLKKICDTGVLTFSPNLIWVATIPVIAFGCFLLKKITGIGTKLLTTR